jgi:hypothetical protein
MSGGESVERQTGGVNGPRHPRRGRPRSREVRWGVASPLLVFTLLSAPSAAATACDGGLAPRLEGKSPEQGGVSLVEIAAPASAGAAITVAWDGKPVPVWRESPRGPWRALVGVDVERKPGPVSLVVTAEGKPPCARDVDVKAGDFIVRELQVPERYVEPNPKDLARAEKEQARLDAVFAASGPERLWSGPFRLPVRGVVASHNFGQRRILNGQPRSSHAGVDFASATGTLVGAAQSGRIAVADNLFFSGGTVVIDHGLGLYTFYGHLSAILVKEGQSVDAGVPVGKVGATGRATGPHLHWSVRLNGARVNPLALVAALGPGAAARPAAGPRR